MDGFNVQRDNKTRDVVVNTEKLEGGQEFNVKREAPKVVPDIGLDLIINKKKEGSQGTRTDSDTETDSINISRGNIPFTRPGSMNAPSHVKGVEQLSEDDSDSGESYDGDDAESIDSASVYTASSGGSGTPAPPRQRTFEDIQAEKQDLLNKIESLENRYGIHPSKRYTIMSNVDDMRSEYSRMKRQRGVDKAIKFGRKALTATVSGIEWLNDKFDPIDAKLDGWAEAFQDEIEDYDETFEELYDKYKDTVSMPPELSLIFGVGGSAIQYHIKKTLFTSSGIKGLDHILAENPDIMRDISRAAQGTNRNPPPQQRRQPPPQNFSRQGAPIPRGPVNMGRPSGVDDILKEINMENKFDALSSVSESTAGTGDGRRRRVPMKNVMNI